MDMIAAGGNDWEEVRRCHDAWIEQGKLQMLAENLSAQGNAKPELLQAIEQRMRAFEPAQAA